MNLDNSKTINIMRRIPAMVIFGIVSAVMFTFLVITPSAPLAFLEPIGEVLFGKNWGGGLLVGGINMYVVGSFLFLPLAVTAALARGGFTTFGQALVQTSYYFASFILSGLVVGAIYFFVAFSTLDPIL